MTSLNQAESRTAEKRYLSGWDVGWLSGQSGHGEQLEIKDTVLLPRAPVTPSGWESCGTKLVPVSRIILSLSYHLHTQDIKQKYWIANHPNNSKDLNGSVFITLCWLAQLLSASWLRFRDKSLAESPFTFWEATDLTVRTFIIQKYHLQSLAFCFLMKISSCDELMIPNYRDLLL